MRSCALEAAEVAIADSFGHLEVGMEFGGLPFLYKVAHRWDLSQQQAH